MAAGTTNTNSSVRTKQAARRKADDDSAYIGASGLGRKRGGPGGGEKGEGSGVERVKRKRGEGVGTGAGGSGTGSKRGGEEGRAQFMDFSGLPREALERYVISWDLVGGIDVGRRGEGVMAEVAGVEEELAWVAERHFATSGPARELDVLSQFLQAVNRGHEQATL